MPQKLHGSSTSADEERCWWQNLARKGAVLMWMNPVGEYPELQLTVYEDRVVALVGLAERYSGEPPKDTVSRFTGRLRPPSTTAAALNASPRHEPNAHEHTLLSTPTVQATDPTIRRYRPPKPRPRINPRPAVSSQK
ncbi:hypothetical protein OPT61_g7657 [Boeremia exigua]|uniref:Uncharacterized protein n=1 Tax=Boeremia exigua TaxID=749465 RepID=A0ACC2I1Y2_9PLEO|nr:hypothetical protein OPT61_g7657 [Boeremia exigua]